MDAYVQIVLIAVMVSLSCAVLGPFLILRKMSMMVDSITHTVLLGIVAAFFLVKDLNSPYLILGAALMGLITVLLTEKLNKTGLVKEDAAIGIIFPLLFSIAIIIISKYAAKIHLDVDNVLLGKIEYAPFDTLRAGSINFGAKSIYVSAFIFAANAIFITAFYKELKICTFDPALAESYGFNTNLIHYALMGLVSVTTVGSFQAVGSILVISFMVGPAAVGYMLSERLDKMIYISIATAAVDALIGTLIAFRYDFSISGTISVVIGVSFLTAFILGPNGLISSALRRKAQKNENMALSVLFHIYTHELKNEADKECRVSTMNEHLMIPLPRYEKLIGELKAKKLIVENKEVYRATEKGIKKLEENFGRELLMSL